MRERLALAVGEANGCNYCLSAHSLLGKGAGLSDAEIAAARDGSSADLRIGEGLRFARAVVDERGAVADADLARVRAAGYSDGEIGEIVANVALNIFTNYFNQVAATAIDFPIVKAKVGQAA
jgi:AhpD family alkylhydroperoxidase